MKTATDFLASGTLLVEILPLGGLSFEKPSLNSKTDNSVPTISLVKFALISSSVGLNATKYPGLPDLILRVERLRN